MAIVSIEVIPGSTRLIVGNKMQFRAIATNDDDTTTDITASATWSSSDPAVASVWSVTGLAFAVSAGSAVISATSGGKSGTATLFVDIVTTASPVVAFAALSGSYRNAEYVTKRFRFAPNTISVIKVLAKRYPLRVDIIYPDIPCSVSVIVTSRKPQRVAPVLVESCEVRMFINDGVTAVFLASDMGELPL